MVEVLCQIVLHNYLHAMIFFSLQLLHYKLDHGGVYHTQASGDFRRRGSVRLVSDIIYEDDPRLPGWGSKYQAKRVSRAAILSNPSSMLPVSNMENPGVGERIEYGPTFRHLCRHLLGQNKRKSVSGW